MRKLTLITLLLLMITPCLEAQRKELSQARSYIKSGKDFDKAEKLMTDLLAKDSANRQNPKIYLLLYQAQKKQYEAGNEKLYLKQKYDTASLFNATRRMFATLESLDSLDATPDKKGNIRLEYRKKHAEELDRCRPNLFYGGMFFIRKKEYSTAFDFLDTYIDCAKQPLFTGYDYSSDPHMAEAAAWSTTCAQRMSDPARILKHSELAMCDTARLRFTLRNLADAYVAQKNDSLYEATLREGFGRFPDFPYFFPKLIDYYTAHNRLDKALAVADSAIAIDSRNQLYLFAKSTILLNLGRNDDCVTVSDTLIAINDSLPDAYFNAATACLNKALALENGANARKKKKNITAIYQKARPYMERYRQLAPAQQERWAPALYRIYFSLNMGKQFEEIDKLMSK